MKARLLVAGIGIPALLLILIWAPDWATALLIAALSVIGAHELLCAVSGQDKARKWTFLPAITAITVTFATYMERQPGSPLYATRWIWTVLCVIAVFLSIVLEYGKKKPLQFQDVCAMLLSGIAIPLALGCLLRLRMLPYGAGLVLIPLVAAFCSDSAALFTGMACGKHKLAPAVSPHKTVEGSIGGLAGGIVGMIIFRIVFYFCTVYPLDIGLCILLGLVGAVLGQLGDLCFSAVKREFGIKDFGKLLPGHGGVLDRFDSVIFAAPVIWFLMNGFFMVD